jgi:hypothetical protein
VGRVAQIEVEFVVKKKQVIDWPDDELENLNYDNLHCNIDEDEAQVIEVGDITSIRKDSGDGEGFKDCYL